MLEPEGRYLLLDVLRPPPGFSLDRAVGTSFTLDLAALLTAPLGFALLDREDAEGRGKADPVALLEAIRRNAERIDIFCQAGLIALPPAYQPIVGYLETSIHESIAPAADAIFHPKVWVIRYRETEGSGRRYRLLCLSRNLTFDRSWDTVLRLEGAIGAATSTVNEPLASFVRALPTMAREPLSERSAGELEELADELMTVRFEPPPGFDRLAFWPLGIDSSRPWPFPSRRDRMAVVSPFITSGCLQRLARKEARGKDVLVSRPESLDALGSAALAGYEDTLVMSAEAAGPSLENGDAARPDPSADDVPELATTEAAAERPGIELHGLHAKLYVADTGSRARVWSGSANATTAAFGGNVEFLVELEGKKDLCGVEALMGPSGGGTLTFRSLLETYLTAQPEPAEATIEERLERRLDSVRRQLASFRFVAHVGGSEDHYRVVLVGERQRDRTADVDWMGIQARCWPLARRAASRPVELGTERFELDFGSLSFEALSSFFAFELDGREGAETSSVRFLINAQLLGAPADRRERLLASLLRNRGDLLRFLLFLLGGDPQDGGIVDLGPRILLSLGEASSPIEGAWQNLFEPMVRALARDPTKLDDIARLVSDLEKTEEGRALLPDDWHSVWEPIWAARSGDERS